MYCAHSRCTIVKNICIHLNMYIFKSKNDSNKRYYLKKLKLLILKLLKLKKNLIYLVNNIFYYKIEVNGN